MTDELKKKMEELQVFFRAGFKACHAEMQKTHVEKSKVDELVKALEYYVNHPSVIKEAYHSNDEKQITVVHTFINHKAKQAIEKFRGGV